MQLPLGLWKINEEAYVQGISSLALWTVNLTQSHTIIQERRKEANLLHFNYNFFWHTMKRIVYISAEERIFIFLKAAAFLVVSLWSPDPPCPPPYPKTIRWGPLLPQTWRNMCFIFSAPSPSAHTSKVGKKRKTFPPCMASARAEVSRKTKYNQKSTSQILPIITFFLMNNFGAKAAIWEATVTSVSYKLWPSLSISFTVFNHLLLLLLSSPLSKRWHMILY